MKQWKRFTSALLAALIVLSAVPVWAGAAGEARIIAGTETAYPDDTVCIPITAENLQSLASVDLEIYYDSQILTFSYYESGDLMGDSIASWNAATVGCVKGSLASVSGISGSGTLVWLYFTVRSNAPEGTSKIVLAVGDAYDVGLNPARIDGTSGSVTVQPRPEATETFYLDCGQSTHTLRQGDTVTLTLYNSWGRSFASGDFIFTYDSGLFRVESVELSTDMAVEGAVYSVNRNTAGTVYVSYASSQAVSAFRLMTLTLETIADVSAETEISCRTQDLYDQNRVPYLPDSRSIRVTLEKLPEAVTYPKVYLEMETEADLVTGKTYISTLKLEEGAGVAAANFLLTYDPAVWECTQVSASKTLGSQGGMVVINHKAEEGIIKLSYLNEQGNPAAIDVLTVQWKPVASAHSPIQVSAADVTDALYNPLTLEGDTLTGCIYTARITEPTCTTGGYTTYTCAGCGSSYTGDEAGKLGHDYASVTVDPTCTTGGITTHTCSRCGDSYESDVRAPLGHDITLLLETVDPTCTEAGYSTYRCQRCDVTEQRDTTQPLQHAYAAPKFSWEADYSCTALRTCTHDATHTESAVCTVTAEIGEAPCEDTRTVTYTAVAVFGSETFQEQVAAQLPPVGHVPVTDERVEPTCTETGLTEGSHCSVCGETLEAQEEIPANGHDYKSAVTAPTCTKKGFTTHTCTVCDDTYVDSYEDALGHSPTTDERVEPTCTETGLTEGSHCSVCGEILDAQESIPANGHTSVTDKRVEPTCTETGLTEGAHCSDCGEVLTAQEEIPATGHSFGPWTETTAPTCTAEGRKTRTCTVCSHMETEPIAAGHSYVSVVTAPTCTEAGFTTHTCSRCGDTYTDSETPALGHDFGDWVVTKEATVDAEGERIRTCTRCPETEAETLPKLELPEETLPEETEPEETEPEEEEWVNPFVDVSEDKFYYEPVLWAYYNGITTGKDATHFNPSGFCTRSQVVTFLWRAAGQPEPESLHNPFPDVPEGKFYTKAVLWAVEQGITNGFKDGTFGPNASCTRGQIVTFLWRYFEQPEPNSLHNPFPDVTESKFYYKAVLWAVENGITGGFKDGTFGPDKTCTRDQIVTFLFRALVQ